MKRSIHVVKILLLVTAATLSFVACGEPAPDAAETTAVPSATSPPPTDTPPPPTNTPAPTPTPAPTVTEAPAAAGSELPAFASLEAGWNALAPGEPTICSLGTDYQFYVRPADPEKLLVFFQGGGACWFAEICNPGESMTYDPSVESDDNPANAPDGIFALDNPENPFADYSMVFVPYCTADVHLGDAVTTYELEDGTEIPIFHNGFLNASTVLDWVYANFDAPETIFAAGSSAGAIPSPFYAGIFADHYPEARVVQLGDGAGGYRFDGGEAVISRWNMMSVVESFPGFEEIGITEMTFEQLYIITADEHPGVTFAQYNTAEDSTQKFFLSLVGVEDASLLELLQANYADIEAEVEDFHTYTAGGDLHVILPRPEFYTYTVGDVTVRDWVAALAAGEPVEDVLCSPCDTAETVE
jgi:hypothetical protein